MELKDALQKVHELIFENVDFSNKEMAEIRATILESVKPVPQQPQLEMPCESDFMAWCGIQHYNLAEATSIYRYIARHIKRVR